jgi:DNA-binding transcriptional ArsR family regulator
MHEAKAAFFRVLANPSRIRILDALRAGPSTVGDLRTQLGIEQATLSGQLAILRAHDLVQAERRGTLVVYTVSHPAIWTVLDSARLLFDSRLDALQTTLETLSRPV